MPWANPDIHVAFNFPGLHHWPDATGEHEYLKHPHRHVFEGNASIEVTHHDRELEFFAVLDFIYEVIGRWDYDLGPRSCEHLAREIADELVSRYGDTRHVTVAIYEDGENGATVHWRPEGTLGLFPT